MTISLRTTVIGSFPKPKSLCLADWFNTKKSDYVDAHTTDKDNTNEDLLRAVIADVVNIQRTAGIDIVTDGELRRENYIYYLCRSMEGVNFDRLERRSLRCGAYENEVPVIDNKITLPQAAINKFSVNSYQYSVKA